LERVPIEGKLPVKMGCKFGVFRLKRPLDEVKETRSTTAHIIASAFIIKDFIDSKVV